MTAEVRDAPKKRPESSRPRPAVDRHFLQRNAVSLPAYFRRLRLFGRFGQLIKSIFAAISISFDLTSRFLDASNVPSIHCQDLPPERRLPVTSSLDELPQAAERRPEFGGRNRHNLEGLMSKTVGGQSQSRVLPAKL
jgi:hypothetical protein